MIDGFRNFRDTGGTPLATGGETRFGVLYRSEALNALTPVGQDQLAATRVGVIVDFRTEAERAMAPDVVPTSRAFRTVDLSILEGAMGDMAASALKSVPGGRIDPDAIAAALARVPTLAELYLGMLQHGASAFAEVARLVAASTDDAPTAVLVHCTAGKDRTGVAVALLLDAVGADRVAVVADYASSEDNLAGPWADSMLATITGLGVELTPQLTELVTRTPASAIEHALSWLDETHGGSAAYLVSGGLAPDELDRLRERLAGVESARSTAPGAATVES